MYDVDQFAGRDCSRLVQFGRWVDHVLAYVMFDHFRDEAVQGAAASGGLLQDFGALQIAVDRALDGCNSSEQPPDSIQQLGLFIDE